VIKPNQTGVDHCCLIDSEVGISMMVIRT